MELELGKKERKEVVDESEKRLEAEVGVAEVSLKREKEKDGAEERVERCERSYQVAGEFCARLLCELCTVRDGEFQGRSQRQPRHKVCIKRKLRAKRAEVRKKR